MVSPLLALVASFHNLLADKSELRFRNIWQSFSRITAYFFQRFTFCRQLASNVFRVLVESSEAVVDAGLGDGAGGEEFAEFLNGSRGVIEAGLGDFLEFIR